MSVIRFVSFIKNHIFILYNNARHNILYRYTHKYRENDISNYVFEIYDYFKENLPDVTAIEYFLVPCPRYGALDYDKGTRIYWETPIALLVYLKGEIAFGIGLELQGSTLNICQLQSVEGFHFPESSQNWAKMSILACCECLSLPRVNEVRLKDQVSIHF